MSNTVYILNEKLLSSERKRFIGIIVDFFFVYVTAFLSGLIMVIIGNVFNWDIFSVWEEFVIGSTFLAFFTFLIINYFIMEFFWGRTAGKLVTGTIVVNQNGKKPNLIAITIRTLSRLIPFDAFSFLGKSGKIWHDSISKTYVVDKQNLIKDMEIFYSLELIGVNDENLTVNKI